MQGLSGDKKVPGKGMENQETFFFYLEPYRASSQLFLENSIKPTKSGTKEEKELSEGVLRVFPRRNLQSKFARLRNRQTGPLPRPGGVFRGSQNPAASA